MFCAAYIKPTLLLCLPYGITCFNIEGFSRIFVFLMTFNDIVEFCDSFQIPLQKGHNIPPLKINPLYAILSGFEVGNTPCVGTFYDFFNRLWDSENDNLSPYIHPVKAKVKKPESKGAKAAS